MTTPDERRRALVQTGAFLKELRGNRSCLRRFARKHIDCCATIRACARSTISPGLPKTRSAEAR
ncbi:MAG: hypothetical protein HZT39_05325 [Pseudoxanthomonas sp.]|nr:MAG: hypothetical protein HZT39_05325 [Pseudoxanthomonas sp.]